MQLDLEEIAGLLHASARPGPAQRAAGYSIDSRTIRPGELFFAIRGPRFDGHEFVAAALDAGAVATVVAEERLGSYPAALQPRLLAVPDPLGALQELASAVRKRWGGPLVAITGSTGKTTTKGMIASLLRTRFQVRENTGNWNNQFGLPLSLLRLEPEDEVGVFELGMSAHGEIRQLAAFAQPDVGVVTNVSAAHLQFFRDVDAIAEAKRELVESLGSGSWAVLNADDARVRAFASYCRGSVVYFGASSMAQFQATQLEPAGDGGFSFCLQLERLREVPLGGAWKKRQENPQPADAAPTAFHLALLGEHNVRNVLAALAVCHLFGIPASHLAGAVARLRPAPMRGELLRLESGVLVVNDCYNSSPQALESMLLAVSRIPAGRRFAVLGTMRELGPQSAALHEACGRRAAELGFSGLITVGDAAQPLGDGARAAGMPASAVIHCAAPEEAGDCLRSWLRAGDVVLLKASRSVHLEKIWDRLGQALPVEAAGDGALRSAGHRG